MQQAISYETWHPDPIIQTDDVAGGREGNPSNAQKFISENVIVVFGRKGCCMATVIKRLLHGLGVNPAIYEVEGEEVEEAKILGGDFQLPAVFIGGKLFGGLDRVMSTHISEELVPILKQAGALWL